MKLIMTLLVRNAQDILRNNIEFHLSQGVDFFIITDNGSTDLTVDIADDYVRRGLAELIYEPQDDYSQARWVTRMARRAATEHKADWVINCDDDEFWHGQAGSLRETIARIPSFSGGLVVQRYNHPPIADSGNSPFLETMIYRETRSFNALGSPLPPKVCHRGYADIEVSQGNHSAARAMGMIDIYSTEQLSISHFPVRDFTSFERKIVCGGAAYARNTELDPSVGGTWRWLFSIYNAGGLRQWYERQLMTPMMLAEAVAQKSLVMDDRVLRAVRSRATA